MDDTRMMTGMERVKHTTHWVHHSSAGIRGFVTDDMRVYATNPVPKPDKYMGYADNQGNIYAVSRYSGKEVLIGHWERGEFGISAKPIEGAGDFTRYEYGCGNGGNILGGRSYKKAGHINPPDMFIGAVAAFLLQL